MKNEPLRGNQRRLPGRIKPLQSYISFAFFFENFIVNKQVIDVDLVSQVDFSIAKGMNWPMDSIIPVNFAFFIIHLNYQLSPLFSLVSCRFDYLKSVPESDHPAANW